MFTIPPPCLLPLHILRPAGLFPLFLPQDTVNALSDFLGFFHFLFQHKIPLIECFPFDSQFGILCFPCFCRISMMLLACRKFNIFAALVKKAHSQHDLTRELLLLPISSTPVCYFIFRFLSSTNQISTSPAPAKSPVAKCCQHL